MQVLMSDSLMNRVSPEEPMREKLLATFVFVDKNNQVPITSIGWERGSIKKIGFGFDNLELLSHIISSEDAVDVSVKKIDVYLENIFCGSYNIKEHDNYSYELIIDLEKNDA